MTIDNLITNYQQIKDLLEKKYPINNKQTRIFAKTVKVMEELGEFCQEIIISQNLHRDEKTKNYKKDNLGAEFVDVVSTLMLLALELDIDINSSIEKKITETKNRLK